MHNKYVLRERGRGREGGEGERGEREGEREGEGKGERGRETSCHDATKNCMHALLRQEHSEIYPNRREREGGGERDAPTTRFCV